MRKLPSYPSSQAVKAMSPTVLQVLRDCDLSRVDASRGGFAKECVVPPVVGAGKRSRTHHRRSSDPGELSWLLRLPHRVKMRRCVGDGARQMTIRKVRMKLLVSVMRAMKNAAKKSDQLLTACSQC